MHHAEHSGSYGYVCNISVGLEVDLQYQVASTWGHNGAAGPLGGSFLFRARDIACVLSHLLADLAYDLLSPLVFLGILSRSTCGCRVFGSAFSTK